MCKYCEGKYYTENIEYRTCSADDNTCEILSPDLDMIEYDSEFLYYSCDGCDGCKDDNNHFEISFYNDFITIGYRRKINKLDMHSFSERFSINFCPMCGRKLK